MKVAFLKVVESTYQPNLRSLRGPLGKGMNDGPHKHITDAGFEDGDDVVLILKSDFMNLIGPKAEPEPDTAQFKVGDTVTWTSQSGGFTKTKTGVIARIVPAGCKAPEVRGTHSVMPRKDVSYVVRVGNRYYWPLVSKLTKVVTTNE